MDIEQRQQLALQIVVPALKQMQRHPKVKKWSGMKASDDDLLAAALWAAIIMAVKAEGSGPAGVLKANRMFGEIMRHVWQQATAPAPVVRSQ